MALQSGTQLGSYRILAPLGAGGMGEVYRATDTRLNREVAIKILPASFANDEDRLRRFEQEALATSALNHPNILTVYDIGTHEGAPYIVAELLEGEELREHLDHSAIPSRKAIEYSTQIASGLAAAQARGIVHRDLKPENIFITADGRVKILDFGLAKLRPQASATGSGSEVQTRKALTDRGVIMGTVGYMSPEQVRGQDTDHRADIFSFGLILYEMLAGRRAFTGESAIEAMNAILKEQPTELSETNAKTNPALEGIVRRCLEKKPEMRFHSAHDLGFELSTLTAPSGSRLETATALLPGGICGSCHSQASASLRYVCRRPTTNSAQALPRVVAGSPTNPMSPEKKEVYVRSFPASGAKWQISAGGGSQPRFTRDGKELFYVSSDRKIMAASVKTDGVSFKSGAPRTLFETHILLKEDRPGSQYAVASDGQRFLINSTIAATGGSPISVVVNWTAEAKK